MDENETAQNAQTNDAEQPPSVQLRPRGKTLPKVGPGNEPARTIDPSEAARSGEQFVTMNFPHEVLLTDDEHRRIRFPAGRVNVPAHLADHWFLRAHKATPA